MSARIRFISAGAGSGKTTALAELLRQELAAGRVHPGGVLATTFTNERPPSCASACART